VQTQPELLAIRSPTTPPPMPVVAAPAATPVSFPAQTSAEAISLAAGSLTRLPAPQSGPMNKFASGSYPSDAQRLAAERTRSTGGGGLWLYPLVFVIAAGAGIGALLLFDAIR
jgi:hypothetical protein